MDVEDGIQIFDCVRERGVLGVLRLGLVCWVDDGVSVEFSW